MPARHRAVAPSRLACRKSHNGNVLASRAKVRGGHCAGLPLSRRTAVHYPGQRSTGRLACPSRYRASLPSLPPRSRAWRSRPPPAPRTTRCASRPTTAPKLCRARSFFSSSRTWEEFRRSHRHPGVHVELGREVGRNLRFRFDRYPGRRHDRRGLPDRQGPGVPILGVIMGGTSIPIRCAIG
jgi:hypothetical protein